jgi:tetratricopeptide (TPR) repeat protein
MTDLEKLLDPVRGYCQLGMFQEASDEIKNLPAAVKTGKEVMDLRARIYEQLGTWELLREVGGYLVKMWPEESQHWLWLAYGTRACRTVGEAELLLLDSLLLHPSNATIYFYLACYASQLGKLDAAIEFLSCAIDLDADVREMYDPDLDPLWLSLGRTPPKREDHD